MKFSLLSAGLLMIACNQVGTAKFEMAVSGENDRDITVDVNGVQQAATITNLAVSFSNISLVAADDGALDIVSSLSAKSFGAEKEIVFDTEAEVSDFASLSVTFANADAAAAAAAGVAGLEGAALQFEGLVDLDGNTIPETPIIAHIAAPANSFTFDGDISIEKDATTVTEIVLDLQVLFGGVDFGLLNVQAGTINLDANDPDPANATAAGLVQANIDAAMSFILE